MLDKVRLLHLSTHSYESVAVDTLLRNVEITESPETEIEYVHHVCKLAEIPQYLDGEPSILVLTGFMLDPVKNTDLFQYLNVVYNVPFAEVFIVGSMTTNIEMASFRLFPGSETESAVMQLYNALLGDNRMVKVKNTNSLIRFIDLYNQYNLHKFEPGHKIHALKQMLVAQSLMFYTYNYYLPEGSQDKSYEEVVGEPLKDNLANSLTTTMLDYVTRHIRWANWDVVPYQGDYVTLGVVSAENYKNEIAQEMISMSNTDKVVILLLEDKGYTQVTVRTRNVDAVSIGKLMDESCKGKPNATTVFINMQGSTTREQITHALASTLREG